MASTLMATGDGGLRAEVALVTGASRGIGRGIAVGLGEAGATVYVTGRSVESVGATASLVEAAGGTAIPVRVDHADDSEVAGLFARIRRDHGRLDLLVNNATANPDQRLLFSRTPFWELPASAWDGMFAVGVRSHFVAAQMAVPLMIERGSGLIVNISSSGATAKFAIVPYGAAKAAVDKMTSDMAVELSGRGITVVSFWPPPTATEQMLANAGEDDDPAKWSAPVFNGRVIAALARSADLGARNGAALRARDLAAELGVEDVLGPAR